MNIGRLLDPDDDDSSESRREFFSFISEVLLMPGKKLAGRFVLLEQVGQGGEGVVWRAEDEKLRREVALKVVGQNEAVITAQLDHPAIIPIYDSVEAPLPADSHFYVMPLCPDGTISYRIERLHKKWSSQELRQILDYFKTVCQAITYAHQEGVVHRDLKPQNILVGKQGQTYVADWGIAGRIGMNACTTFANGHSVTFKTTAIGTPEYLSPEAADEGLPATMEMDIFGLGAILYQILTSHPPWKFPDKKQLFGSKVKEYDELPLEELSNLSEEELGNLKVTLGKLSIIQSRKKEFNSPKKMNSRIPKELSAICKRAINLKPAERYSNADQIVADLERWMSDVPLDPATLSESWTDSVRRWIIRNKTSVAVIVAASIFLLVGSVILSVFLVNRNHEILAEKEQETHRAAISTLQLMDAHWRNVDVAALRETLAREQQISRFRFPSRYWQRLADSSLMTLRVNSGGATAVAASMDGQKIVTGSAQGVVTIWDAFTGSLLHELVFEGARVDSIDISSDGQLVAVGDARGVVRIWNTKTFQIHCQFNVHRGGIHDLCFSPDSTMIAAASAQVLKVFKTQKPQAESWAKQHEARINGVAFSPDGELLASASDDGTVRLWSAALGEAVKALETNAANIGVEFTSDNSRVVSSTQQGIVNVWDQSGELLLSFAGFNGPAKSIALGFDDRLLLASVGSNIAVVDIENAQRRSIIRAHAGPVTSICTNRTRIFTASDDNTVCAWSDTGGQQPLTLRAASQPELRAVHFSRNGSVLCTRADGSCVWWDSETGHVIKSQQLKNLDRLDHSSKLNLNGSRIAAWSDGLHVWDVGSGAQLFKIPSRIHRGTRSLLVADIGSVAIALAEKHASTIGRNGLYRWELASGEHELIREYDSNSSFSVLRAIESSPDGKILAASRGDTTELWRVGVHHPTILDVPADLIRFSDGSSVVATSCDAESTVSIWDVGTGKRMATMKLSDSSVIDLQFAPQLDDLGIVERDGTVSSWKFRDNVAPAIKFITNSQPVGMSFDRNGPHVAIATVARTVELWNTDSSELTRFLRCSDVDVGNDIRALSFDTEGKRLCAVSPSTVYSWDTSTGGTSSTASLSNAELTSSEWHADFARIVSDLSDRAESIPEGIRTRSEHLSELKHIMDNTYKPSATLIALSPDGTRKASLVLEPPVSLQPGTLRRGQIIVDGIDIGERESHIVAAKFDNAGHHLAVAEETGEVRIFGIVDSGPELRFQTSITISSLAFGEDENCIITGHRDGKVNIWDVETGQILLQLDAHEKPVTCVCTSRDGLKIASSSATGEIKVWDASSVWLDQ